MGLVELIISIGLFGFLVFLILQIPMPVPFQRIVIGVACFGLLLWLLQSFGLVHNISGLRIK